MRFISLKGLNYFVFTDPFQCICRSWCHLNICTNLLFSLVRLLIINSLKQILNKLFITTANIKSNEESKKDTKQKNNTKKTHLTVLVFLPNTVCSSTIQIFKLCQQLDRSIAIKIFHLVLKVWAVSSEKHLFCWIWCTLFFVGKRDGLGDVYSASVLRN